MCTRSLRLPTEAIYDNAPEGAKACLPEQVTPDIPRWVEPKIIGKREVHMRGLPQRASQDRYAARQDHKKSLAVEEQAFFRSSGAARPASWLAAHVDGLIALGECKWTVAEHVCSAAALRGCTSIPNVAGSFWA